MFQGCLACILFAIMGAARRPFTAEVFNPRTVLFLCLSSTIGIILGDWTWFEALRFLGARRVILIDSLKPYFAAFLGWVVFNEALKWPAFLGMFCTVSGVVIVSLETEGNAADEESSKNSSTESKSKKQPSSQQKMVHPPGASYEPYSPNTSHHAWDGHHHGDHDDEDEDRATNDSISFTSLSPPSLGSTSIILEPTVSDLKTGYILAASNVIFDTSGAVITRLNGEDMTVWEIGLVRFGFASTMMLFMSLFFCIHAWMNTDDPENPSAPLPSSASSLATSIDDSNMGNSRRSAKRSFSRDASEQRQQRPQPQKQSHPQKQLRTSNATVATAASEGRHEEDELEACRKPKPKPKRKKPTDPWYALPVHSMTWKAWRHAASGVILSTFIFPALYNYSLFRIPLALALTLGSLGPVYALPLAFVMQHHKPTSRACLGAVLAVLGIVILAFWGTPEEEDN